MTTPLSPLDRHAEAIAQVTSMRDQINAQMEHIDALKRELQTERDRVALLTEERARWRTDAMACRTFVTKLATIQESINRATEGAARILDDMAQMDSNATTKESIDDTTKTIEENLAKMRNIENESNLMAPMQAGPRTDA